MKDWKKNIISNTFSIKQALGKLNEIGVASNVLYVVDDAGETLAYIIASRD